MLITKKLEQGVNQKSRMESEQRQVAKKQMMVLMQEGYSWHEAASRAGIRISRSTAYRWFQQFRTRGEGGLHDGRHGHTAKMHKPIQAWLEARCREEPTLPSSSLQKELNAHCGVLVSITHLNLSPRHFFYTRVMKEKRIYLGDGGEEQQTRSSVQTEKLNLFGGRPQWMHLVYSG